MYDFSTEMPKKSYCFIAKMNSIETNLFCHKLKSL
jgi:ubiquinone biosynthesis protein Coq4